MHDSDYDPELPQFLIRIDTTVKHPLICTSQAEITHTFSLKPVPTTRIEMLLFDYSAFIWECIS